MKKLFDTKRPFWRGFAFVFFPGMAIMLVILFMYLFQHVLMPYFFTDVLYKTVVNAIAMWVLVLLIGNAVYRYICKKCYHTDDVRVNVNSFRWRSLDEEKPQSGNIIFLYTYSEKSKEIEDFHLYMTLALLFDNALNDSLGMYKAHVIGWCWEEELICFLRQKGKDGCEVIM